MPACFCPHCKTRLWVKETQLNVAQGFVVCQKCEGMFKAKDHLASTKEPIFNDLPEAVSDVKLVHRIGTHAMARNRFPATKSPISSTAVQPCTIRRLRLPPPLRPTGLPSRWPPLYVRKGSTGLLQPCLPLSSSSCSFSTSRSYKNAMPFERRFRRHIV